MLHDTCLLLFEILGMTTVWGEQMTNNNLVDELLLSLKNNL